MRVDFPPSAEIRYRSATELLLKNLANATFFPSGDQTGITSETPAICSVSRRTSKVESETRCSGQPFSRDGRHCRYTSDLPSGDQAGPGFASLSSGPALTRVCPGSKRPGTATCLD